MPENELLVFDENAVTDSKSGGDPHSRTIEELLESGIILVNKPRGPTSHQLAAWTRELLGIKKLGHGGTLDPFATGLLTLLCGKATRLTDIVLSGDKTYVGVFRFSTPVDESTLAQVLSSLVGKTYNVPPRESAVKVRVRSRRFGSIEKLDSGGESKVFVIEISCEAGSYIRTLARDIGLLIGTPCELIELHRTKSGTFDSSMACTMQQLTDAVHIWKEHGDDKAVRKIISPIERVLVSFPTVVVKDGAAAAVSHGASLARPGIARASGGILSGSPVVIQSLKGEAVAIAELTVDTDSLKEMQSGEVAIPKSVLMAPGTYTQTWSKD